MPLRVVLVSTYDLGRQPFGLASPAAWLREDGARVVCFDLSRERLQDDAVREADLVAFHVPMHTATRLALPVAAKVRRLAPQAHLCFYGLYAALHEEVLRAAGGDTILGGEFEEGLTALARDLAKGERPARTLVSHGRQQFRVPDRAGLPVLDSYARLRSAAGDRTVGYTEASRGCKHRCRHCPIVPVYDGAFRLVQADVVLEDVRRQIEAGATHVTFGDPDFWNSTKHARAIVEALHRAHPKVTYDVTIKVEHLIAHATEIPVLVETGCAFVTTAAESVDDDVLAKLDKGHTRADFEKAVDLCRAEGLGLSPTFVPFTPWTTLGGYLDLLGTIASLGLVDSVAPVQLAIRLLVTPKSRLFDLPEIRALVRPLDPESLFRPWTHADPRVDDLAREVQALVWSNEQEEAPRRETFEAVWELAHDAAGIADPPALPERRDRPRAAIPWLDEPWYC